MSMVNRKWYPNSRLRLLAAAVAAFPPYLLLNSSFTLSRKKMGISLSTDSTATTQNAARFAISLEHQSKIKFSIFASTEVIDNSDHQISSRYEGS